MSLGTSESSTRMIVIVLFFTIILGCHGQQYEETWTFNQPGLSYMEFIPDMKDGQDQQYSLTFRTLLSNGLLLYHHIKDSEVSYRLKQTQTKVYKSINDFVIQNRVRCDRFIHCSICQNVLCTKVRIEINIRSKEDNIIESK